MRVGRLTVIAAGFGAAVLAQQANIGIAPVAITQPAYEFDTAEQHRLRATVVARALNHPFSIAFLPNGDALIAERGGALRLLRNAVGASGRAVLLEAAPVAGLPAIEKPYRSAGLHDLALHPQFAQNGWVYFTFNMRGALIPAGAAPARQQSLLTVMRARFDGRQLNNAESMFQLESGSTTGSRIAFGKDGLLYLIAGAAFGTDAQKLGSSYGKSQRIRDDGSVPQDNPYVGRSDAKPAIFTLGHRDPLGLAIHPSGAVLAAEHGPNGGDEVNLLQSGRNYGWPNFTFGHGYDGAPLSQSPVGAGIEPPLVVWNPSIGPSGLMVYNGDRFPAWKGNLFVGSVRRGQVPRTGGLERVVLNDKLQELRRETLLTALHQRIRDVREGPDGLVYVLTDEDDGVLLRLEPIP
jgi:aldose sugar dehydrogenase